MPGIVKGFVLKTLTKIATLLRALTPTLSKAVVVIKKTGQAKLEDLIVIIINRTLIKGL
jgi:hypothetical protein